MKSASNQFWMVGLALAAAVACGCQGGSFDFPIGIGNPDINIETGDVNTNVDQNVEQTQNVSVIQNVRIGDNIMIRGGMPASPPPPPSLPPDEVVVPEDIPECIPVDEITEDQLVAVCLPLQPDFPVDDLQSLFFQFEGLEGVVEVPADELRIEGDQVCFDIQFIGELGASDDPIAALGGVTAVGNALDCIYQLETAAGVTPQYVTLVVQEGNDCDPGGQRAPGFSEIEPQS